MPENLEKNKIILISVVAIILFVFGLFYQKSVLLPNSSKEEDFLQSTSLDNNQGTYDYILVDISGAVNEPGVYRLRSGARLIDLIIACKGLKRNASTEQINLAQPLKDGDKISISYLKPKSYLSSNEKPQIKVKINSADIKELDSIPGIGPGLAQRIIDYRLQIGRYSTVEQLKKVSGIGKSKFEKIKDYIDVD